MFDTKKLVSEIERMADGLNSRLDKVESEASANKAKAESDIADVKTFAEGLLKTPPAPSSSSSIDQVELDTMVKAALNDLMPDVDMSSLSAKIDAFGAGASSSVSTAPAPLPVVQPLIVPPADVSKKADLSTLFSTGSNMVPAADSPAAVGSADMSTTTLGSQGSQDPSKPPEPKPASVPQKIDPAAAGKLAADAATSSGDDPVPAAAKAAHAAAIELGVDPVDAAKAAAQDAGAGPIEALRAAQNADLAANEGQAPATA